MATIKQISDGAVLATLGGRLARHRLQRNLTQAQLSREAGISKRTLIRLESGESSQLTNLIRVVRALNLLGNLDSFVPAPVPSPIEQLRSRVKERQRASRPTLRSEPPGKWTWGEDEPKRGGEA